MGHRRRRSRTRARRAGLFLAGVTLLSACRAGPAPEAARGSGDVTIDSVGWARENERQALEELAQANKAEARSWLADSSHGLFEGDREQVVRLVESLYQQGAREVYVTGIEALGGRPVTATLVVVLPDLAASRTKVFEAVGAFLTGMGEDSLADVGQKHLLIALD